MDNIFTEFISWLSSLAGAVLSALSPLFIGLILAYLLNPAVDWLKPKVGVRWAIFITYITLIASVSAILYGFIILITGALPTGSWQETVNSVIRYFKDSYASAASFLSDYLPAGFLPAGDPVKELQLWLQEKFSFSSLAEILSAISGGLISFFLGAVASVYLLKDKEFFLRLWERFLSLTLKQKAHGLLNETIYEINSVVTTFLKGAFIDSVIVAFLSSVVLSLLKVDYAVIIGCLGGLLNIIPYFGPFFGMAPAFIVAFFTGGITRAAAAVIGLFLVQQIDCNLIYPKIVGTTTGLHPLFVLLSVSIFGYFFGIAGMILAVPAAGILQILIRKWAFR